MNRPRGKPFQPGNPFGKGRPPGSRNKATIQRRALALLDAEGEAIISKAIEGAKAGQPTATRLCIERLLPRRRERSVQLTLPGDIKSPEGIANAFASVTAAMARGDITPAEGAQISKVLEAGRKSVEMEVERRLNEFAAQLKKLQESTK